MSSLFSPFDMAGRDVSGTGKWPASDGGAGTPPGLNDLVRLGRFVLVIKAIALASAAILGAIHAFATRSRLVDSFSLMAFLIFLLMLGAAILSGPGLFLSRPYFTPLEPGALRLWRQWISVPSAVREREFFELLLYTGLAFLFLVIATGIDAVFG